MLILQQKLIIMKLEFLDKIMDKLQLIFIY